MDTEFDHKKAITEIEHTIARLQAPKRLLLVDDDPADVDLITRILDRFHVVTTVAHSGDEARAELLVSKFDLVFFDLVMPGLDGLSFMMSNAGLHPGTRFILVTGYPLSPRVEAVLRLGCLMLAKPLTQESLEILLPLKPTTSS